MSSQRRGLLTCAETSSTPVSALPDCACRADDAYTVLPSGLPAGMTRSITDPGLWNEAGDLCVQPMGNIHRLQEVLGPVTHCAAPHLVRGRTGSVLPSSAVLAHIPCTSASSWDGLAQQLG